MALIHAVVLPIRVDVPGFEVLLTVRVRPGKAHRWLHQPEWGDVLRDLDRLQEVEIDQAIAASPPLTSAVVGMI